MDFKEEFEGLIRKHKITGYLFVGAQDKIDHVIAEGDQADLGTALINVLVQRDDIWSVALMALSAAMHIRKGEKGTVH